MLRARLFVLESIAGAGKILDQVLLNWRRLPQLELRAAFTMNLPRIARHMICRRAPLDGHLCWRGSWLGHAVYGGPLQVSGVAPGHVSLIIERKKM
jgi:hypothetical protein